MLFFEVICQVSRSRRPKIDDITRIERFRTITPVLIHRRLRNDAESLGRHGRDALLFFKVTCQISRPQGSNESMFYLRCERFRMATPIHGWVWVWAFRRMHGRGFLLFLGGICQMSRSRGLTNRFGSHLRLQGRSQLSNSSDLPCFI